MDRVHPPPPTLTYARSPSSLLHPPYSATIAVPECNPKIDELEMLVDKLNSNESLSEFTLAVRKAWCKQCLDV